MTIAAKSNIKVLKFKFMETVGYKHLANLGDLFASMPGMKHVYDSIGKKAVIMHQIDIPAHYYPGATHPTKDDSGTMVCMNKAMYDAVKPLVEAQYYVERMEVWEGQPFDLNMDKLREGDFVNMPYGVISQWQFMVHPLLFCDISKPWIFAEPDDEITKQVQGKILINVTERYRNHLISYYFLEEYQDRLLFVGTDKEHEAFCSKYHLKFPKLKTDNFLQVAQAARVSKLNLCNQSAFWNLCDGMKVKRLLEQCRFAPNCFPIGEGGYSFLHQDAAQILFKKLIK
jgi:hypothetical protein